MNSASNSLMDLPEESALDCMGAISRGGFFGSVSHFSLRAAIPVL
jgi:hypothetical protein